MTILLDGLRVLSHAATLVDGVDLELTPGTSTALVGASGAGKSLTCAALAGLLPPNLQVSGSLTVTDGQDDGAAPAGPNLLPIPAAQRPRGARIALVPQDPTPALHPLIPVGRQIEMACAADQGSRKGGDAEPLLARVGLEGLGDRVPARLSGGQRQRACLALALAGSPALLIADEPTTALDVIARAEILDLLASLTRAESAPALLLITHDLPAAATCQSMAVMAGGRIIEQGPTERLLTRPAHPATAAMRRAAADETLSSALAAVGAHQAACGACQSHHAEQPGAAA